MARLEKPPHTSGPVVFGGLVGQPANPPDSTGHQHQSIASNTANNLSIIIGPEDRRTGYQRVGAGIADVGGVAGFHAAVDLQADIATGVVDDLACLPELVQ
jgi:hypothetical protein